MKETTEHIVEHHGMQIKFVKISHEKLVEDETTRVLLNETTEYMMGDDGVQFPVTEYEYSDGTIRLKVPPVTFEPFDINRDFQDHRGIANPLK